MAVDKNIVAVSDLHLGAPSSLLHLPDVQSRFFREIDALHPVTHFIMVGDVLDLTMSPEMAAWNRAQQFFRGIGKHLRGAQVYYLPGNHDHHVWAMLLEQKHIVSRLMHAQREDAVIAIDELVLADVGFDSNTFVHALFPEAIRQNVRIRYPFVWLSCGRKRLVFHHGHYFDSRIAPLAKRAARKYKTNKSVEEHSYTLLEGLYYNASVARAARDFLSKSYTYYQLAHESFSSILSTLGIDGLLSEDMTPQEIREMMGWLYARDSYILVAGHTHRPYEWFSSGRTIGIFNTGGWIVEAQPTKMPHVAPAIFHALDGECELKLFDVSKAEISMAAEKAENAFPL